MFRRDNFQRQSHYDSKELDMKLICNHSRHQRHTVQYNMIQLDFIAHTEITPTNTALISNPFQVTTE